VVVQRVVLFEQMQDGEQNNILQQCNGIFRMKENHMEELVVD